MPRDSLLDSLKAQEQQAFQRKQEAFERYKKAKDEASRAHSAAEAAWKERSVARDTMNRAFEKMKSANSSHDSVWSDYGRIRDENNARIDELRREADREHQSMIDCFSRASNEYEYGDKSMASSYSQEGRDHKERRNELNDEIKRLCQEVKDAKQDAMLRAPKTDNSDFKAAKQQYELAKARHEAAEAEFKLFKSKRDELKSEFDYLQGEYKRIKSEFEERLEKVKAENKGKRDRAINNVNTALVKVKPFTIGVIDGKKAKIVDRNDGSGKKDVYFSGLAAAGDGLGHGHAVIDRDGNVTYLRDAWSKHDDYLINDRPPKGKPTHNI